MGALKSHASLFKNWRFRRYHVEVGVGGKYGNQHRLAIATSAFSTQEAGVSEDDLEDISNLPGLYYFFRRFESWQAECDRKGIGIASRASAIERKRCQFPSPGLMRRGGPNIEGSHRVSSTNVVGSPASYWTKWSRYGEGRILGVALALCHQGCFARVQIPGS
jgi:hypothetical protein